jgi:hypothetical protein
MNSGPIGSGRPAGTPQRHADPRPVEQPAECQMDDPLAVAVTGEAVEALDSGEILREARRPELWI